MAKPSPQQLAYCLTQVTRFIPSPAPLVARAQASKWGMKVGQLLGRDGVVVKVVGTDSLGLTLETPDGAMLRFTDKGDLDEYTKVRAARKPKKAKKNVGEGEGLPLFDGSTAT